MACAAVSPMETADKMAVRSLYKRHFLEQGQTFAAESALLMFSNISTAVYAMSQLVAWKDFHVRTRTALQKCVSPNVMPDEWRSPSRV